MFDKLVESTKHKEGWRSGRFLALTSFIYALVLAGIGVGTIVTFSPALAEEYRLIACPPPPFPSPLGSQLQTTQLQKASFKAEPPPRFVAPEKVFEIPPAGDVKSRILLVDRFPLTDGGPYRSGNERGVPGLNREDGSAPPPIPPPAPKPPTPTPAPEKPQPQKVSDGVLEGIAIQRIKPVYPQIARQARSSGPVQVQVTISEEGRVIEAIVLSGPPLLRSVALEAARRWVFSPTKLSNMPVKVQGVLTFNFTLE